ncbi:MAG: hypothetical protein IPK16_18805 [Anaerolineales bacterium]|nr:hypothetical protein [Anaerolineales bacterium]
MESQRSVTPWLRTVLVFGSLLVLLALCVAAPTVKEASAQDEPPDATADEAADGDWNVEPDATEAGNWVVLAWNDLGMHCYNADFSNLAVLPPYNTLWAQVIRRGDPPRIITRTVSVSYSFPNNKESASKTNFWQYDKQLFGVDLPLNKGLTGAGLSGKMKRERDHFIIEGIPLTEFSDSAPKTPDPYQLATIVVKNASGTVLAKTRTVAPVSSEMHCDNCHFDGGVEGIRTGKVDTNILTLHDKENKSEYPPGHTTPLMQRRPVLCAECHASNALGAPGQPGIPNLSKAMHKKHADADLMTAALTAQAGDDLEAAVAMALPQNFCYNCHPGPATKCLRDVMSSKGMTCTDCHGGMDKVASNPNPWLNEPRCDSCHKEPEYRQNHPLFRFSTGHSGIYCEGCHDSTHAIAPSTQPKDAIKFIGWQGHKGTLDTCTVCHITDPSKTGPHGMSWPWGLADRAFMPALEK